MKSFLIRVQQRLERRRIKTGSSGEHFAALSEAPALRSGLARLMHTSAPHPLLRVPVACLLLSLKLMMLGLSASASTEGVCEDHEVEALLRIEEKTLCTLVPVPLDHSDPSQGTIELRVVTMPATSRNPMSDPMVFIAGGPGQSAVRTAPFFLNPHRALRTDRDFVFIDQRGTGGSASLACASDLDALFSKELQWWMTQETAIQAQKDALAQCLTKLPYSPKHFTTQAAVIDLAIVLDQLGYDQVNLFGVSYGTRMALSFLRDHEALVRTMILDAVAPHAMVIPAQVAKDARASLEQVLEACTLDAACGARFPNIQEILTLATNRLEGTIGPISTTDPLTGEIINITTWPDMLSNILRAGLYSRELIRLFPLALERGSEGDFGPLITIAAMLAQESPNDLSLGMMASVLCSEDMTRLSRTGDGPGESNPLRDSMAEICSFWPHNAAPDAEFAPVISSVPTLLLSGQFDPITPSHYAESIRSDLTQSQHIVVAGGAHGVSSLGCVPQVVESFVNTPDPQGLDIECARDIQVAPFFLSPAGAYRLSDD
ncbi:MAG: alpha/beta hydrolase [Pseudomonadales bacterium]